MRPIINRCQENNTQHHSLQRMGLCICRPVKVPLLTPVQPYIKTARYCYINGSQTQSSTGQGLLRNGSGNHCVGCCLSLADWRLCLTKVSMDYRYESHRSGTELCGCMFAKQDPCERCMSTERICMFKCIHANDWLQKKPPSSALHWGHWSRLSSDNEPLILFCHCRLNRDWAIIVHINLHQWILSLTKLILDRCWVEPS